jgi:hypothetical protein
MVMLLNQPATTMRLAEGDVERRRGLRIAQNRPVKVFEPSVSRYFGGQTADVSATGLRLELPLSAAVRPGKVLHVHVGTRATGEPLANRRSMIPARVVWVDRSQAGERRGTLTAGVEFVTSIAAHLDAA